LAELRRGGVALEERLKKSKAGARKP